MLPLPRNFFECPPLQGHEAKALMEAARINSLEVIANTKLDGSAKNASSAIQWVLDGQDGQQLLYKGHDWDAPMGVQSYLGVMEIQATLDEVAQLYACYEDDQLRDFCRTIAKDALDVHQLYVLAAPSDDNPRHFIGVKWAALRSPAPAVIRHRDWVFLESHHDFEWQGRRGWARATKSIMLPFVPELDHKFNLVRGYQHRAGFVFVESERPGYLQAVQLHQFDYRGKVPSWMITLGIKKRCRAFLEMAKFLRERRLSSTTYLLPDQMVAKESRSCCNSCLRRFRVLFNPKHHCRRCGEVVCQSCSKVWVIKVDGIHNDMRVCTSCALDVDLHAKKLSTTSVSTASTSLHRASHRTSHRSSTHSSRRSQSHRASNVDRRRKPPSRAHSTASSFFEDAFEESSDVFPVGRRPSSEC